MEQKKPTKRKFPDMKLNTLIPSVCAALLTICAAPARALAEDTWPLWRGTPDMRGISTSSLKFPMKQVWKVTAGRPIIATAVSDGAHAYLGDGSGKFQALALAEARQRGNSRSRIPSKVPPPFWGRP
jgi:hypothetical protein